MADKVPGLAVYIAPELERLAPAKRAWFEALGATTGKVYRNIDDIPDNVPVVVGPTDGTLKLIARRRFGGAPAFYWDRGYFHRNVHDNRIAMHRIVVNATQKNFVSLHHSGARTALPYIAGRKRGGKILILGHSGTAEKYHGLSQWEEYARRRIAAYTDRPVEVRQKGSPKPMEVALEDVRCVVSCMSNAAVEAAFFGVPVICSPDSAAWETGQNDFSDIESPRLDGRVLWAESLSWGQFTFDEMLTGEPFATVLKIYEGSWKCRSRGI